MRNLTLRWDVTGAVAEGTFHIYAAEDVSAAVELLTGRAAGARDAVDRFPAETVFGAVQARLDQFARRWHDGPPH